MSDLIDWEQNFGSKSFNLGSGSKIWKSEVAVIYVGITFLQSFGGPNSRECSLNLEPIFTLGFNLEFESEILRGDSNQPQVFLGLKP